MENINAEFPIYPYKFKVLNILAQSGSAEIEVKYIPDDERLTSVTFVIPFLPNFDVNNMASYVDQWAPRAQWFAQEMILNNEAAILNSGTANT